MKKNEDAITAYKMAEGHFGQTHTREYDAWIHIYKLEHIAVTGIDPDEPPDGEPGEESA
jgi:hypothetical protein